jgi:enamine deaminase RidA (YjgF/YER057c/UK114 family)
MHPEDRLRRMGLSLPAPPAPLAHYVQTVQAGALLFVAGQAPLRDGVHQYVGKVGREWTEAQGYDAARLTALNLLATVKAGLGDLDRVRRVISLFGMVNCTETFTRLDEVIDGASDLVLSVWGKRGRHARTVAGMQQLHFGMAIEVEGVFEVD